MILRLPKFLESLQTSNDESNTTKVQVSLARLLSTKLVRVTGAAVVLLLLFGFALRNLDGLDRIRPKPHVLQPPPANGDVNWSRFAYTQYVTDTSYLCNSVMLFEILNRLGSKPDRLMMYPSAWSADDSDSLEGSLLRKARDEYGVKLMPIEVQRKASNDPTWAESFTKLLAFNQTQYDRVLSLDSDSTVLQHMDELFLIPKVPVAMPRAYWLNPKDRVLSSQLVLLQPSEFEFERVQKGIEAAGRSDYDMEIVNTLYRDSALILPHRPYDLITGEFRSKKHNPYLGNDVEPWDPDAVLREAKFLHFSDWPVPKPWISNPSLMDQHKPACDVDETTREENCRGQELWLGFYSDFATRRKRICDMDVRRRKRGVEDGRGTVNPSPYEPIF
ncbi:N-acetylglucosaminyltransferase [Glutinoglossum americanum]|uniref:N-acetylglucosaminyltransferase n=1 Tax=Glutinoglossum americanum TaxID=1670608 RepID=A0A9P8I3H8_9PEZI|nr:N-acetylglucosaminyltransferase [Glutinoglossum americanum]